MTIMCAPVPRASSSARFRLARTAVSSSEKTVPPSSRGGMLISRLNWPISVWKSGSAIASSAAALASDQVARLVRQVELDLQAGRVGIEPRLSEHPREDVQARAHLQPMLLAILPAEDPGGDLLATNSSVPAGRFLRSRRRRLGWHTAQVSLCESGRT